MPCQHMPSITKDIDWNSHGDWIVEHIPQHFLDYDVGRGLIDALNSVSVDLTSSCTGDI